MTSKLNLLIKWRWPNVDQELAGWTTRVWSADSSKHKTFVQRRPNVFDVGPTLYQSYTNILCLLGSLGRKCQKSYRTAIGVAAVFTMGDYCACVNERTALDNACATGSAYVTISGLRAMGQLSLLNIWSDTWVRVLRSAVGEGSMWAQYWAFVEDAGQTLSHGWISCSGC